VNSRPESPRLAWITLITSLLICLGVWRWSLNILAPANAMVVQAAARPVGNNSDLYPRWLGAREVILHHRDPYSAEVTRESQIGFYGRPLNPRNPNDPTAKESFVYPLYVTFLLAPFVTLPFSVVSEIFRWLLLASIMLSVPLWMSAFRYRARWQFVLSGMLLAGSTFSAVEEYFQQNLAALVMLFVAAAAAATARRNLVRGGFFLALATVKPDTTGLMVSFLLFWSAGRRERQPLLWAFLGTWGGLILGAEIISPGWLRHFFAAVWEYPSYGVDPNIVQVLFPGLLGTAVLVALVLSLIAAAWLGRNAPADSEKFSVTLAWIGAVTLVVLPKLAAYNALLLIPAFLVLLRPNSAAWNGFFTRAATKAAFACQSWQWATAASLSLGSVFLPIGPIRAAAQVPLYTVFALWPITLLALLGLTFSQRTDPNFSPKEKHGSI
jgi:hypothetical protein